MTDIVINGVTIELTEAQSADLRANGWLKLTRAQCQQAFGFLRPMRPEHTERTIEKALAVLNDDGHPPDAA